MKNHGKKTSKLDYSSPQAHHGNTRVYNDLRSRKNRVEYVDVETGELINIKIAKNEARSVKSVRNTGETTIVEFGPARVKQLKLELR